VWKGVYGKYKKAYSNSMFQKDTLKDCFQNVLKEFKTNKSNEEGSTKVVLQNDQLKVGIDGHATLNVLKRQQSVIDGTSCHPFTPPTLNDILQAPSTLGTTPSPIPSSSSVRIFSEGTSSSMSQTKAKML
jgi:hypothetical protein